MSLSTTQRSALRAHKHDASHGDFKSNDGDTFQKRAVCREALHRVQPRGPEGGYLRRERQAGDRVRGQTSAKPEMLQETPSRPTPSPVAAESQGQDACKCVQQRAERKNTRGRAAEGVCVRACARAGLSRQAGWRCPLGTLATTLRAGLVSCHQTAALSLLPSPPLPRLGAGAQADEATQTGPLCAGSGGFITRGLSLSSAPRPQHERPGSCCPRLGEPSGRHVNSSASTSSLEYKTTYTN